MTSEHTDDDTPPSPVSTRRIAGAARILAGHPDDAVRVLTRLDSPALANLAEVVRQLERDRAIATGDHDAVIDRAFETAFGADGIGVDPWIESDLLICPGSIVSSSRTSHRCRFVSVDDTWVWDSVHLLREDKRAHPGSGDGFRAVALLPVTSGLSIDVVAGRARRGVHRVDHVVSYSVRRRQLVEVAQRTIAASGLR